MDNDHTTEHVRQLLEEMEQKDTNALAVSTIVLSSEAENTTVIEGEIHLVSKLPFYTRPGTYILLAVIGLVLTTALIGSVLVVLPFFTQTATITITPDQITRTQRTTLHIPGHVLPAVTQSLSMTTQTTGTGYQQATSAKGSLIFYNAAPYSQTIEAGTLITSTTGIQVITDATAYLPAAVPPTEGYATIPAHTLQTGAQSNLSSGAIAGFCCRAYILVKNTTSFTGGLDARTFQAVSTADLARVVSHLTPVLKQSIQHTFTPYPGETLTEPTCEQNISSDHTVGAEAKTVTVTVTAICTAISYDPSALRQAVKSVYTQQQPQGYRCTSIMHTAIDKTAVTHDGIVFTITLTGIYQYQITQQAIRQMQQQFAGKTREQVTALLLLTPHIQHFTITSSQDTLPRNSKNIHVHMLL